MGPTPRLRVLTQEFTPAYVLVVRASPQSRPGVAQGLISNTPEGENLIVVQGCTPELRYGSCACLKAGYNTRFRRDDTYAGPKSEPSAIMVLDCIERYLSKRMVDSMLLIANGNVS